MGDCCEGVGRVAREASTRWAPKLDTGLLACVTWIRTGTQVCVTWTRSGTQACVTWTRTGTQAWLKTFGLHQLEHLA